MQAQPTGNFSLRLLPRGTGHAAPVGMSQTASPPLHDHSAHGMDMSHKAPSPPPHDHSAHAAMGHGHGMEMGQAVLSTLCSGEQVGGARARARA